MQAWSLTPGSEILVGTFAYRFSASHFISEHRAQQNLLEKASEGDLLAILKLAFMTCHVLCSFTVIWSLQALNDLDSNILFPFLRQMLSLFIFFSSGSTSCFHPEDFSNRSP